MSDTRDRILQTATTEFLQHGYSRVKTEDLANLLGISKRTLYKHFPSKKRLFTVIVKEGLKLEMSRTKAIIERIASGESTDLIDELRNIWESVLKTERNFSQFFWEDVKKYIPNTWKEISAYKEEIMKNHISLIYNTGVKQGIFCPDINEELIFIIHFNTFKNIFESNIMTDLSLSFHELMTQFFEIVFFGIIEEGSRGSFIGKFR